MTTLTYKVAKPLIQEGDVLLFKGQSFSSFFIARASVGNYTHVGIASLVDDIVECVEFREWKGGRSINLEYYAKNFPDTIDVYRPVPFFSKLVFDPVSLQTNLIRVPFQGRKVTNELRKMTGLPYGWKRIFWIGLFKLPFFRYFIPLSIVGDDSAREIVYPVCSTALSYCFNKFDYDLISNRSDEWTEPSDISKSTRLNYLFTIGQYDIV